MTKSLGPAGDDSMVLYIIIVLKNVRNSQKSTHEEPSELKEISENENTRFFINNTMPRFQAL